MERIVFRLMLLSCIVYVYVYAAFVDARKWFEIETSFVLNFVEWYRTWPVRVLHKLDYKFQDGGQNGGREKL